MNERIDDPWSKKVSKIYPEKEKSTHIIVKQVLTKPKSFSHLT